MALAGDGYSNMLKNQQGWIRLITLLGWYLDALQQQVADTLSPNGLSKDASGSPVQVF